MAKSFESKLIEASSEEKLKAAKQLLKTDALTCAWRDAEGRINATFQDRNTYAHTEVSPGDPGISQCSCRENSGKLCEHAVAAIMYCGRFRQENHPLDDGISNYAGLKYESLDALASREKPHAPAQLTLEAASAFPHVPSKWENAVLNVRLRNAEREYLGNVNNLRQLFFEKTLSISLKLDDFSLQDQQIIRYLAINGEPDNSSVLLNSEQTAEFFHCLIGFERFRRDGRRLFIHGDQCEAVILRKKDGDSSRLSPGIRVGNTLLPIRHAKVITGRAGCWIGRQGEYYFVPATVDVGWLRSFFRTGEQDLPGKGMEKFMQDGHFPLPVVQTTTLEVRKAPCQVLLGGLFDAEKQFHLRVHYLYDNHIFPVDSGRLARIGDEFLQRDECAELRLEKELEMFGFRRNGKLFSLKNPEAAGEFLDRLLPVWMTSRNNVCLEAPLARLAAGGNGLEPISFSCRVRATGKDHYLIEYDLQAAGETLPFKRVSAAARTGKMYFSTANGMQARISEPLRGFMKGAENILRMVSEKEHTFELPFHSAQYFLHLTEKLPAARPPELVAAAAPASLPCEPPAHPFQGTLRPYQQEGVDWLRRMTDAGFNVILADEMGLGKTIQLLALLAARKSPQRPPALVICPASLVTNWERECRKFIPDFQVAALAGSGRENVWENPNGYDLIVTSYATARRDAEYLKKHHFSYLILDEAQHIKNPGTVNAQSCKAIAADHRIVLTGTPLENSTEDLWSIFDFLHPGMLGSFNAFRHYYADIRDNRELQEDLAARVAPFLKRRTKAEVGQELPPKQERMLFCVMDPQQRQLYESVRESGWKQLSRMAKGDPRANAEIFTTLLRLRQICCHPGLLPDPAAHQIPSAKFELLQELVLEHIDSGHKLLLFSQFTTLLGKITEWLDAAAIRYEYLDGTTRNRQTRVDHFNNDPEIPLFLLSLKAGGTGLNLTSADTVVICDPWWNPAVELQATDRTHRIGQTRPVSSLKLLVKDSIEEKILNLQEQKQEIFDHVIDNPNAAANKLSIEELQFLLS